MAVARVTAADYNTVRTALECTEYKHGVDTAGTGYSDYLYIGRIGKPVVTCKVSTCVRTPVTAECNYQRFIFIHLHIASTSAMICKFAKPLRSIAPEGQATVHAPQP